MALTLLPRWLQKTPALLVLQVVNSSFRYIFRENGKVEKSGLIPVAVQGRLFDVATVRAALLAQLGNLSAQVAVLLPSASVHLHYLSVPTGLDDEESDYQVTRHITHELELSLNQVYYDWELLADSDLQGQSILLAVARQSEVAQYAQLFTDTEFKMRWVCAEALLWGQAYTTASQNERYAVCQIEHDGLQLYWFDELERVRALSKVFDKEQMSKSGFEYTSGTQVNGKIHLPQRFVVDEVASILAQVHLNALTKLYVSGAGVHWPSVVALLQSRLGLPVQVAKLPEASGSDEQAVFAGLWQLSERILKGER